MAITSLRFPTFLKCNSVVWFVSRLWVRYLTALFGKPRVSSIVFLLWFAIASFRDSALPQPRLILDKFTHEQSCQRGPWGFYWSSSRYTEQTGSKFKIMCFGVYMSREKPVNDLVILALAPIVIILGSLLYALLVLIGYQIFIVSGYRYLSGFTDSGKIP